jgi:conjugal transfer pilus assembly protein TraB
MQAGIGGGTGQAAKTLSDYYIKRAEQYHPIIPIGAGNEVTLVFQDGFQLETLAEARRKKQQKGSSKTIPAPTDPQSTPNMLSQLHEMKVGDLVSPVHAELAGQGAERTP